MVEKRIRVVAGILRRDGKILIAQRRSHDTFGGKWEFPGGKVRDGESDRDALVRELQEELNVTVTVGKMLSEETHDYTEMKVSVAFFECETNAEEFRQHSHQAIEWVAPFEFDRFDFLDADLPLLKKLSAQ